MNQLDMFDMLLPTFRFEKNKPIRVVELFSGIGFQAMGMSLAEIPYEVVATSEIDKYAIKSYEAIHGHNPNLGSITDIEGKDIPSEVDIMTYSFPCTDLSKTGKQKGLDNTRSGLVYEVLRILRELHEIKNLPKVLIMENVVDLVQQKFIKQFNEIQLELEGLGYTNYTQTLNAKNYGIAQNRDRVFMVSILGEYNYNFPKPFKLEFRLKNYLEKEVDEKYYLSDRLLNFFIENSKKNEENGNGFRFKPFDGSEVSKCITTNNGFRMDDNFVKVVNSESIQVVGSIQNENNNHEMANRIYGTRGASPSIRTYQGGNLEPKIIESGGVIIPEATEKGYAVAQEGDGVYINRPHQKRGVVQKGMIQTLKTSGSDVGVVVSEKSMQKIRDNIVDTNSESKTITANPQRATIDSATLIKENHLRIRKLTPRETGRLMGMNDEQIDKQLEVVSNSQAYKQHGNGIVAQVIGLIIGMMYYEDEEELREIVMKNSHRWVL